MNRKSGYYWVNSQASWMPAYYNGLYWRITGSNHTFKDECFDEINESEIFPHASKPSFSISDMKKCWDICDDLHTERSGCCLPTNYFNKFMKEKYKIDITK